MSFDVAACGSPNENVNSTLGRCVETLLQVVEILREINANYKQLYKNANNRTTAGVPHFSSAVQPLSNDWI